MAMAAQYDFLTTTRMLYRGIYTFVSQPPSIHLFWYWALKVELLLGKWHPSPRDLPPPKANRDSVEVMKCEMGQFNTATHNFITTHNLWLTTTKLKLPFSSRNRNESGWMTHVAVAEACEFLLSALHDLFKCAPHSHSSTSPSLTIRAHQVERIGSCSLFAVPCHFLPHLPILAAASRMDKRGKKMASDDKDIAFWVLHMLLLCFL